MTILLRYSNMIMLRGLSGFSQHTGPGEKGTQDTLERRGFYNYNLGEGKREKNAAVSM